MNKLAAVYILCLSLTACGGGGGNSPAASCTTLDCTTSKYNLLLADVDFTLATPAASK